MDEIRFFMEESLVTVEPGTSLREAAQKMRHHSISSVFIAKKENYLGLLTDTDLTRKLAAKNLDPDTTSASTISNNPIITLDASYSMEDAYECMRKNNIRHLGVTEKDKVIGILSVKDFANYFHNKYNQETDEKGEIQYFMNDSVLSIESGKTVLEAAQKMAKHKVGALIISEAGKVKGLFSESVLTMNVIAAGRPLDTTLLSEVVVLKLNTMDLNETMSNAYQKMRENNIRHLSISNGKKIIGILSIKDFANYYSFKHCQDQNQENQIGNYMRESLATVPESTSIQKAAQLMKENRIGSLFVTQKGEITGIVTEEIFTRKVLGENLNPETTLVSELMENPTTIKSAQSMDSALSCMHKNDVRYLAVTESNKIKGIISLKDLTIYYKNKFVTSQDINE
ncbi:MAG: CBS domain-containing protein [Nitrospina sp.]|jgi:CBS domain-containing protein|nr:CBS domain-containing protein [Nitrospina sp.]MBT5631849.1 CBS domain-containing protein [Nitrospina sp.]